MTKIIANSKRSVAIESANNLIRSAELYFVTSSPRYGKLDVLSNEPVTLDNIFCNRFKPGGWHWSGLSAPYNYMGSQKNLIYFIIDNNFTKISVDDSLSIKETKIKDWFETNETKIYFPLETLQIENRDLPDIEVLEGYNNITINTNVQPSNVILIRLKKNNY